MPATAERTGIIVAPFGIECDLPRNGDLVIQSIPGCRLRSAVDGMKSAKDAKSGEYVVPTDQAKQIGSIPKAPGMQLHVNPAECSYVILDPLHGDERMCEKLQSWMVRNLQVQRGVKVRGHEPQQGTLDVHRMKTLCREMFNVLEAGEARMAKGPKPDMADIDELPGYYMLNPGSRIPNTQPIYEKDMAGWISSRRI